MWDWIVKQLADLGREAFQFVLIAVICAIVYPIIRMGWHARVAIRLKRQNYRGEQLRRSARYAIIGISIAALCVTILWVAAPPRWWVMGSVVTAILMIVGWFGYMFVPEQLAED